MRSVDLDRPSTMTDVVLICRISTVTLKWQKCSDMCHNDQRGPLEDTHLNSHTHLNTHAHKCTHTLPLSHSVFWFFLMCTLCQTWSLILSLCPRTSLHNWWIQSCLKAISYIVLYITSHTLFFVVQCLCHLMVQNSIFGRFNLSDISVREVKIYHLNKMQKQSTLHFL